ncbi:MAG: TolC family outer membrane protein [Gammaproteobacteria bacterium]|jgi:outer membrane protein|nr:TolC family outer membrane protein [Gammaproteobacteria bacterium]
MKRVLGLSLGLMMAVSTAAAEDLKAVYDRALANDPQIREAEALRRATREAKPQAWAAVLPQISGSASRSKAESEVEGQFPQEIVQNGQTVVFNFLSSSNSKPETDRWSLDLRQSLISWDNWVAIKRADRQVAQSEADYQAAEQQLILRVSEAYFNVLAAQDTVDAQASSLEAISRQLEQAEKRFEVGLIAITDVQEARAARDSAAAAVIASKRQLASTEELLREITAEKYRELAKPGDSMPLKSPEPQDETQWVERSMEQNLALVSSRLAAEIARDNVRIAFGGHLPKLDLVASKSNTDQTSPINFSSGNVGTRTNNSDDTSYALQVTMPLFSGGATQSRVRQTEYQWQAARERLTRVSRQTERQARDAYLGVISEISRVNALGQALESSRTALKATEAGYEVGTRTAVDVLESRRALAVAETNYSRSRYDYILNVMRLRLASGTLDRSTLEEVNTWLTETSQPR